MDASKAASEARQGLAESLRRLVGEADELLAAASATGDKAYDTARDHLAEQLQRMRSELEALEDAAGYATRKAARAADRTVHEHPYGAMAVAAAVGVLVGFLAARR